MSNKNFGMVITGAAVTMAAGAAYMATRRSGSTRRMKKLKKSTSVAMKNVGSVINDLNKIMG